MVLEEKLAKLPVFKGLNAEKIKEILSGENYYIKFYPKDSLVISKGEKSYGLNFVLSGKLKSEMIDFKGKTVQIGNFSYPNVIAPAFVFGNRQQSPVDLIATEDCELFFIPKESLMNMAHNSNIILENFLNILSNKVQFLTEKIWFLSFQTIEEKLINFLISKSDENFIADTGFTQERMAEFFGVSRPSLGRVISKFTNEGLLEVLGKGKFKLNNIAELRKRMKK